MRQAPVMASDLRASAALGAAGLIAEGLDMGCIGADEIDCGLTNTSMITLRSRPRTVGACEVYKSLQLSNALLHFLRKLTAAVLHT